MKLLAKKIKEKKQEKDKIVGMYHNLVIDSKTLDFYLSKINYIFIDKKA